MKHSMKKGDFNNLFKVYTTSAKSVPGLFEILQSSPITARRYRWDMLKMCKDAYNYYLCNYSEYTINRALIAVANNL